MNNDRFYERVSLVSFSLVCIAFAWMIFCGGVAILRESDHAERRAEQLEAREGE